MTGDFAAFLPLKVLSVQGLTGHTKCTAQYRKFSLSGCRLSARVHSGGEESTHFLGSYMVCPRLRQLRRQQVLRQPIWPAALPQLEVLLSLNSRRHVTTMIDPSCPIFKASLAVEHECSLERYLIWKQLTGPVDFADDDISFT